MERPGWQKVIGLEPEEHVPEGPVFETPEDRAGDAREEAEWFQRLPDHAKEDLRERWRTQEGEGRHQKKRRKRTTRVYVVESTVIFLLLEILLHSPTWISALAAPLFGAATGLAAGLLRSNGPTYASLFSAGYLLFGATAGGRHFAYYLLSVLIVLCIGSALGVSHRLQKFDGSDL